MTDFLDVSNTDPLISYTVGGTPQTVFVVPFVFFADTDLVVKVNGVQKTLTTDYTVTGAANPAGGAVTFLTPQSSVTVLIFRDVPLALSTHIPPSGPLDVPGINLQFSKLVAMIQQLVNRFLTSLTGVVGPLGAGNNNAAVFDGTTGALLKDSGAELKYLYPQISEVTGIKFGHKVPILDENVQFGGIGVFPFGVVSPNPIIFGAAGSTIGSAVLGQTFTVRFTSTSLAGSPISITYTAQGGDTTATIAAALCALINANATLHDPVTGLPIFAQSFAGSATFNIQWSGTINTLTLASTGTGTITIPPTVFQLDGAILEFGRAVPGWIGRPGDALMGFTFTGQSTTGLKDTHYAQIVVYAADPTAGSQQGQIIVSTAGGFGGDPAGRILIKRGVTLYDSAQVLAAGGDQGAGTVNLPVGFYVNGGLVQGLTITPAQITSNQNDYNPTGGASASVWRITSDARRDVTGIAGGVGGRRITLRNEGNFIIALLHESGSSTAANRFVFPAQQPVYLAPRDAIELWYDTSQSRWTAHALPAQITNTIFTINGIISPAQITSNQNDYNPTGADSASVWRISSDAARNATGIAAHRGGEVLTLINIGSFTINLINESASSTAGNRFSMGADFPLLAGRSVELWYDITTARWRRSSEFGSPATAALGLNTWYLLAASAAAVSLTGTTSETTLATISVPANAMGANGVLRITTQWGKTGTAGAWTARTKFNATEFVNHGAFTASNLSARQQVQIANRGVTNSQVGSSVTQGNWSQDAGAIVTSAHDTTGALNITITIQLANAADTVRLEAYTVELAPRV